MSFSPSDFKAGLSSLNDFSRAAHFEVTLPKPPAFSTSQTTLFRYFCRSASIPGVSFEEGNVRRYGGNFQEYYPVAQAFDIANLRFISDGSGTLLKFLKDWFDNIVIPPDANSTDNYRVNYPAAYTSELQVQHFSQTGNSLATYTLHEAWPVQQSGVNLDWSATDIPLEIPVNFRFRYWSLNTSAVSSGEGNSTPLNSTPLNTTFQNSGLPGLTF